MKQNGWILPLVLEWYPHQGTDTFFFPLASFFGIFGQIHQCHVFSVTFLFCLLFIDAVSYTHSPDEISHKNVSHVQVNVECLGDYVLNAFFLPCCHIAKSRELGKWVLFWIHFKHSIKTTMPRIYFPCVKFIFITLFSA